MMQETRDVVILVARIANGVAKSLPTWEASDILNFAPASAAFFPAIQKCTDIPAEFAAATDADRDELAKAFCAEFSIPQAAAELMVEKAIAVVVAIWNMIK